MSHWNYIDEMYSDIRQETTDQLDQHIKMLVERCGYTSAEEKTQCQLELLFHAMKHFEVKKKVGKIADSSKWNSHFWQVITACKATRSNH